MKLENVIATSKGKKIYRDGDKVIKVFNEDFSKANVLNEALNHARVEETDLNIPKLHEVTRIDGKWAIVMDYIEGKTLETLMKENPNKIDEYIELLVNIQVEILSKRVPLLSKIKDKMHGKIASTDLSATTRYELHTRLDSTPKHAKLCHGDLNPGNIIVTDSGEHYIIDWSHATQGNGAADAARTFLLFSLSGDAATAEKYINTFCKKTDTAKQYIQRWIPIVAASQLAKGIESEKEFLQNWADVVDYE